MTNPVAAALYDHIYNGCTDPRCHPPRIDEDPRPTALAICEHLAEVVSQKGSEVTDPIIRYDNDTQAPRGLDEFVAHNATIHFEAMGEAQFWIGVTLEDGRTWAINCGAVNHNAKGYAICEEDS